MKNYQTGREVVRMSNALDRFGLNRARLTSAALLLTASALPSTVMAQEADGTTVANAASRSSSLIVVTARKREESILEAPLSIQAFTNEELNEAGLVELESVAEFTPNLDFQNLGNSQPGRFNTGIRFRGMDSTISTPTNQTGALFVDGISVLGGGSSIDFSDIASVEIIRGPQPVFFGRGTFGGAINYVTADPGDEFGGRLSASYSPNFGSNYLSGFIEGPLTEGLTARLTGFTRTKGAMYTANDGGKLGEENTYGLSAIVLLEPSDRVRIKARLAYSEDDDGPPSSTFVSFRDIGNVAPGETLEVLSTTGAQTGVFTRDWYSGVLPVTRDISSNTSFYTVREGLPDETNLADALLNLAPQYSGVPNLTSFGLRTDLIVASLAADFELSDALTLSGLFGYNRKSTSQIRDTDQTDVEAWAAYTFLDLETYSAEVRLAYDNGGPLRLTGGVNYTTASQFGDIDGGFSVFDGLFGNLQVGYGNSSLDNVDINTLGIFGAVEYDILDWLTISAEGRQQFDESTPSTGNIGAGNTITQLDKMSYNKFLPRIIVSARPWDGANLYLSYSEGTLPGTRNSVFDPLSPEDKAAAQAEFPFIVEDIGAERLQTYELGWKQEIPSANFWFSAVAFTQDWSNMKSTGSFVFTSPTTGLSQNLFSTVAGDSRMRGIELEADWQATQSLKFHLAYGYVDAKFIDFVNQTFDSTLGLNADSAYKADGNALPRSPKHSGAASAVLRNPISEDWFYQLRSDVVYRGRAYTDELNLTQIGAYTTVNARLAFQREVDGLELELFCNNCFDKKAWSTGRRLTDFGLIPNFFTTQGVVLNPVDKFEAGVRVSFEF